MLTRQKLSSSSLTKFLLTGFFLLSAQAYTTFADDVQPQEEKVTAEIKDVAWIAGHWQGEAMGGKFEETWNPPFADSMVGMFKFAREGKVEFYEILTIVEVKNSLMLRLKHFDRKLVSWEEKSESVEFPLVRLESN